MALCFKKGAAIVALFSSFQVFADIPEYLLKPTPKNQIYQPPQWFARLANEPLRFTADAYGLPEVKKYMGNLKHNQPDKKGCRKANGEWGFCDL